jgi:3-oxoacyl-[acyl-carrier protein] reductase
MTERPFAGRVALVTGGSGGIGSALSARLAAAGASVAVHFMHNRTRAEEVVASITETRGATAAAFHADLRDTDAPEHLVHEVEQRLGPVDILAANAGIATLATYDEVDAQQFVETLNVNLTAPYLLARRTLGHMREQRFGRILFTSSVAAFTGGIVGPHYAASKSGLHGLTHHFAARTAADGVTVNAIAPALIEETTMLPADPGGLVGRIPVGRLGKPAEVAELALALLANAYVTNKVVTIDGGIYPY